jgi:hypothetical protein
VRTYGVTIPITGKAYLEVEAEDEEAAIDEALNTLTIDDFEDWEPTSQIEAVTFDDEEVDNYDPADNGNQGS